MKLTLENYIFLSSYIPLPLSAIKYIEQDQSHPFHNVSGLKNEEILKELKKLHKINDVSIKKIPLKVQKIENLINNNIFDTIFENLEEWKKLGIKLFTYFDNNYPLRLKSINNPPKIVFTKGNINFDYSKAVSIIGTRNPTQYGSEMAKKIGYRFAKLGFTIINGFAKGVDSASITGGLEAGGKIIGVLGSGLLNIYPKENRELFREIVENERGFFISEQLPNKAVVKSSLATRNRISSALSIGNVFIEGASTSGTRYQLDYGRNQNKPVIVLKPKSNVKQAQLPKDIIRNEKNIFLIENVNDIDNIAKEIINIANITKRNRKNNKKQKSITDF